MSNFDPKQAAKAIWQYVPEFKVVGQIPQQHPATPELYVPKDTKMDALKYDTLTEAFDTRITTI